MKRVSNVLMCTELSGGATERGSCKIPKKGKGDRNLTCDKYGGQLCPWISCVFGRWIFAKTYTAHQHQVVA